MKLKKLYTSLITALAFSPLSTLAALPASDVTRFVVAKGQDYFQTNASTVLTLTNNRPFKFTAFVDGSATDSVLSASLKLPNTLVRVLTNSDGNFDFEAGFTNKAGLDAAYGVGSYTYTIVGLNDGTNKPVLALPADNFPPVPKLANWDDVQAVEAAQPLNLSWGMFTNGTTNDFILVSVATLDGSNVVSTPALFDPSALNGTNFTAQIPADSLSDGTAYQGSLLFVKRSMLSTNYHGAKGLAGYFRQTDFPLTTLPAPAMNGRIQFSASQFSGPENPDLINNVTITRSGNVGVVSVSCFTTDGTAIAANDDYNPINQTVDFADGETEKTIALQAFGNHLLDGNRTVNLHLADPQGGAELGGRSNAVFTIIDDEIAAAGKIQFATRSNSVLETAKFINLTVNRVGGSSGTVTAYYYAMATFGDTAVPGLDFVETNNAPIVFGSGITSKLITVPILNNSIFETNLFFHVGINNLTGGAAFGTNLIMSIGIVNDDLGGTFAFKQSNYVTNENSTNFLITVVRTGGIASGVTVDFNTADGTALDGVRYYATNGTLSFGSNELSKTFQVGVINDLLANGDQSLTAHLSNATGGAKVSTNNALSTATLTIKDDESSVAFTNANYVVGEGVGTFSVTVTRVGALFTPASVDFSTADISANAGLDYRATNGTLLFAPGVKSKTFSISITNDTIVEADETFLVQLSNPTNCLLGAQSATTVTITNNDFGGIMFFSTNHYSVAEGGTNVIITLVRSNGLASGVTALFTTADSSAVAGTDYSNATQIVTFNAGEKSKKVLVPIINNSIVGGSKMFLIYLASQAGGGTTIDPDEGNVTISEDDLGGSISFTRTNISASESATNFYVNVARTGGKASGVTVDYFTTGGTATSDVDYANTFGTLTFAAGETNKIIAVGIIQDTLAEGLESFTLTLTNAQGGAALGASNNATLNIIDDENSISISNAVVDVSEGAGKVVVTLVRSGVLTSPITFDFTTANGSATAGSDYGATNGTLTIPANVSVKTITIPIVNDTVVEGDEDFTFSIFNAVGGGVQLGTTTTQTITIKDNDFAGTIQFGAASFSGTEGGTAAIKVTRTGGLASGIIANFVMSGGTATSGLDYTNMSGTLTFAAGETNKTILVPIIADSIAESTETVNLTLSGPNVGAPATAILSLADKPDPNAVPLTGPLFIKGTTGGVAFNSANTSQIPVTDSHGGLFQLTIQYGFSLITVDVFPQQVGTLNLTDAGANGTVTYILSSISGASRTWFLADSSTDHGATGTFTFDAIDHTAKLASGRFNLHLREAIHDAQGNITSYGGFVDVIGSFRVKLQ